jgi:hypothetical protein
MNLFPDAFQMNIFISGSPGTTHGEFAAKIGASDFILGIAAEDLNRFSAK